ncbi:MAG: ATP-binding protein [Cognatishimia activa]
MIKIESIHVKKFRGIIDLKIDIGGNNFTICGPNGTGKSGIIDAIEFALSGDISRLSGTGRGDVSIKNHAPHVDYRDNPEEASVSLSGTVVKTGDTFVITRNVADIHTPDITPQTPAVLETLQQLAERRNISLSRRELIQYIISTKKDRASQVNALLQLGQLSSLRDTFQKISNAEERYRKECESQKKAAAEQLSQALDIPQLKVAELLAEVNKRRKTLGLEELDKLEANTSLIDGLATLKVDDTKKAIDKKAAANDLAKLQQEITSATSENIKTALQTAIQAVRDLSSNKMAWSGISKQNLLNNALKHLDSPECPVCETPWEIEALKQLIATNISSLETAVASKTQILRGLSDAFSTYRALGQASKLLGSYGEKFDPKHDTEIFKTTASDIESHIKAIEGFASEEDIVEALEKLSDCCSNLSAPHVDLRTKV